MKTRQKQRQNRKYKAETEEMLDKRNGFGVKDLTPYNAVARIKLGSAAPLLLE
ncbi:MAG: hypothetical protein LUH82_07200 [Clostridiales bacterium]|nr:hypothetical protein [Clostridiales bacterium]